MIEVDPRHYYRWNYYFQMWMHTGIIHFKRVDYKKKPHSRTLRARLRIWLSVAHLTRQDKSNTLPTCLYKPSRIQRRFPRFDRNSNQMCFADKSMLCRPLTTWWVAQECVPYRSLSTGLPPGKGVLAPQNKAGDMGEDYE